MQPPLYCEGQAKVEGYTEQTREKTQVHSYFWEKTDKKLKHQRCGSRHSSIRYIFNVPQTSNFPRSCKFCQVAKSSVIYTFTFTFMHLTDTFIQSDLQCIQAIHLFHQYVCSLGIEPTTFCAANTMLYYWATGTLLMHILYVLFMSLCVPVLRKRSTGGLLEMAFVMLFTLSRDLITPICQSRGIAAFCHAVERLKCPSIGFLFCLFCY